MTRISRGLALLAAVACLGPGCKGINTLKTKSPDPGVVEGDWQAVRGQATRRGIIYDQFQHRATITATYLSPSVREARAARLSQWQGWTQQELTDRLNQETLEAAKYDDFLVSFFTENRRANDLDAPQSVWRIALRLDTGDELLTHDAKAIDGNATVANLFPYVSVFDTVYRVRFNRAPGASLGTRRFTLEVASALGKMELNFGDGQIGPDMPQGSPIQ